jgi:hypothetical protein
MTMWTVFGLAFVTVITVTLARLWTNLCRRKERESVEAEIKTLDERLTRIIDEDPTNLAEHLRLAAELDRLRAYRDSL